MSEADARQAVAVIGHALWTREFRASDDVIGQRMMLNGSPYVIVGVAPASFVGTEIDGVDLWLPLETVMIARSNEASLRARNRGWLRVHGRLRPEATVFAARAEATWIASELDRDSPERRTTIGVSRASRLDWGAVEQPDAWAVFMSTSAAMMGMVAILFFVCSTNAAALLLARGAAREREIALRVALGASRRHVIRQLAAEVFLIAVGGAGVGVLVCFATLRALASVAPNGAPIEALLLSIRPDAQIFGFAVAVAFALATLFGLAPARQTLRIDCLAALKGSRANTGDALNGLRFRRAVITVQVAASAVLLVIAALVGRSASQAWESDPGFETTNMYIVGSRTASPGGGPFVQRLAEVLARQPGIRAVSRTSRAPFFGDWTSQAASTSDGPRHRVGFSIVDPGYFSTLGVPLIAGRSFLPQENDAVIINSSLARRLWSDEGSALGRTLFIPPNTGGDTLVPKRIVGVVPTVQTTNIGRYDDASYYEHLTEEEERTAFIVVRTDDGVSVGQVVSDAARAINPDALVTATGLDERMRAMVSPLGIVVGTVGAVGLLALVVAAVGIHGVIAYTVSRRTRDIGIYRALGAKPSQVLRLIVGWTLRGVLAGALVAVILLTVAAMALGTRAQDALNGVNPLDPVSFFVGVAILAVAIAVATYLPTRRALGLSPLDALRTE